MTDDLLEHGPVFPAPLNVPAFLKVIPSLSQAREAAQAAANAAALALVSPAAGQPGSVRGARKRKPTARASEAARPSLIPSLCMHFTEAWNRVASLTNMSV